MMPRAETTSRRVRSQTSTALTVHRLRWERAQSPERERVRVDSAAVAAAVAVGAVGAVQVDRAAETADPGKLGFKENADGRVAWMRDPFVCLAEIQEMAVRALGLRIPGIR